MDDFEVINHTADIGIVAHGADIKTVFANAARAMFSLITDLDNVEESICHSVEVSGEDRPDLLIVWLNELIYLFDTRSIVFKRVEIIDLTCTRLKAMCYGEKVNPVRHELKMEIKAATYHLLEIEENDEFKARVLFDI